MMTGLLLYRVSLAPDFRRERSKLPCQTVVASDVELEVYCGLGRKRWKKHLQLHVVSTLEQTQEQNQRNLLGLVKRRKPMMGLLGLLSRL